MDWKLTKSIYLAVFLLINIVFIIILINKNEDNEDEEILTNRTIEESDIDTSSIEYENSKELNVLNAVQHEFPRDHDKKSDSGDSTTEYTEELKDISLATSELEHYIKDNVYHGDEYEYDSNKSDEATAYFNQTHDDLPIFNNSAARIKVSEDDLMLEQGYVEDFSDNEYSKKVTVRDPLKLVEELYQDDMISSDAVIKTATLGYYLVSLEEEKNQVMLRPKWQFVIEEDTTRVVYMDALNASEEIIEKE